MMAGWLTKELHVALGSRVWAPPVWAVVLALLVILFFCRLGTWQLDRATEKDMMTARFEAGSRLPAMALPVLLRQKQIEDRRVFVDGQWDNGSLVYLDSQMRGPRAGLHVYTVFLPEGSASAVLVNRGWVPVGSDIRQLPSVPPGRATRISGSIAYPSDYFTVGEPDYAQRPLRVSRLDMDRLSGALGIGLHPFVVRLDAVEPDGFVRDWAPASRLGMVPEKHRAYAFQWFSLAFAVLVVVLVVNLRRKEEVAA